MEPIHSANNELKVWFFFLINTYQINYTREVISLRKPSTRQDCCFQQIKYRRFLVASSYRRSQFLWHGAFRQSLSVSFILSLIYSFKRWQPHSKTMAHKLQVELTSIIMQIWGKKSPIVTHSSKFLPPPVLDIQGNKLLENIPTSLLRSHLE